MNRFNPKVSIVIPVYNGSNFIREAIDSALAQTYKNIEIIVINDGSNDNGATEKIAKSYGKKIHYLKKENGGVASALNLGIKKMTGEYFSWLSHDDMYYPEKIKRQVKFLRGQKNRNLIIFTDYEYVNETGELLEKIIIKNRMPVVDGKIVFLNKLINGLTLLVPKTAFNREGVFDLNKKYTQDYDMWYRLLIKYDFKYLNFCGVKTRLHKSQDSRVTESQKEADIFWINITKEYNNIFKEIFPTKIDFLVELYSALKYSDHEKTKEYVRNILAKKDNFDVAIEKLVSKRNDTVSRKWKYLAILFFVLLTSLALIVISISIIL